MQTLAKRRPGWILFKLDSGCSDHLVDEKAVLAISKRITSRVKIKVAKETEAAYLRNRSAKMADAGIDVMFSESVIVVKKNGKLLTTGLLRGGLYELELSLEEAKANHCEVAIGNLWHR